MTSNEKSFASQNDMAEKRISFSELASGAYAFTAEGDPNSGVVVGEDSIMVIEAQATPRLARKVIDEIRKVSDKPISHLVLTHYHAVRALGASAYQAPNILSSQKTLEMLEERGEQDWLSEFQRFPRLFQGHEEIPGLTWPTHTFEAKMKVDLGGKKVELHHLGGGHTRGDVVVWLPDDKVLFAGDLVEFRATPYCGDAQLKEWPLTLQKIKDLKPNALVPGRGDALIGREQVDIAIDLTLDFVTELYALVTECREKGLDLGRCYDEVMKAMRPRYGDWVIFEHCMCFNVSRAYDEACGIEHPRIWTQDRDVEMWRQLNSDSRQ